MDKVEKRFLLALIGLYIGAVLAISLACNTGGVTTPNEPQRDVANVSTPNPVAGVTGAPTPTAVDTSTGWEGSILPKAGWSVKNTSANPQPMVAYYTDFDDQALVRGSKAFTPRPGDIFAGSFNTTCVQVDLTFGAAGSPPFLFGYINKAGDVVKSITNDDRAECGIVPCVEKWVEQEPVITYTEWTACDGVAPSCSKTRTKRTVIKEKNSCTNVERVKSDVSTKETGECPVYESKTGEFVISYLSHGGNKYRIEDDRVVWRENLDLKSGSNDYRFPHAIDSSNLCLYYNTESIGCAKATCPDNRRTWHGNVSFACKTTLTCTASN